MTSDIITSIWRRSDIPEKIINFWIKRYGDDVIVETLTTYGGLRRYFYNSKYGYVSIFDKMIVDIVSNNFKRYYWEGAAIASEEEMIRLIDLTTFA